MKKTRFIIIQLALAFTACNINPVWDDYYAGGNSNASESALIKELEQVKDISLFVDAIRQYELDTVFSNEKLYTILAPSNEAFKMIANEIAGDTMQMKRILLFHCFEGKTPYDSYTTGEITSLSNKRMKINFDEQGAVIWGDGARALQTNRILESGILHVVDKVSFPGMNLYEYISSNSDLKAVKSYIENRIDVYFDRWNSEIIAYTPLGEPIYDSVFVVSNSFLRSMRLDKDESAYTFIFPDNVSQLENKIRSGATFYEELPSGFLAEPVLRSFLFRGAYTPQTFNSEMKSYTGEEVNPKILSGAYGQKNLSNGYFYYTKNYDIDLDEYFAEKIMEGKEIFETADTIGHFSRYEFYGAQTLFVNYISGNEANDENLGVHGEEIPKRSPVYNRSVIVPVTGQQFLPIKYKLYVTLDLYKNYLGAYDIYVNDTVPTFRFDYPKNYLDDNDWLYNKSSPRIGTFHEFELGEFFLKEVTNYIAVKFTLVKRHESVPRGFGESEPSQYLFIKDLRIVPVRND